MTKHDNATKKAASDSTKAPEQQQPLIGADEAKDAGAATATNPGSTTPAPQDGATEQEQAPPPATSGDPAQPAPPPVDTTAQQPDINAAARQAGQHYACFAPSPDGTFMNRIFIAADEVEGTFTRADAIACVQSLEIDGYADFRLPTESESVAILAALGDAPTSEDAPFWTSSDAGLEQARTFTLSGQRRTAHVLSLARVLPIRSEPLAD
jgi:hypothetical protein